MTIPDLPDLNAMITGTIESVMFFIIWIKFKINLFVFSFRISEIIGWCCSRKFSWTKVFKMKMDSSKDQNGIILFENFRFGYSTCQYSGTGYFVRLKIFVICNLMNNSLLLTLSSHSIQWTRQVSYWLESLFVLDFFCFTGACYFLLTYSIIVEMNNFLHVCLFVCFIGSFMVNIFGVHPPVRLLVSNEIRKTNWFY